MKKYLLWSIALIHFNFLFTQSIAQQVSFGVVTDIHHAGIPDNGARTYNQSLTKLSECMDTMNKQKVDFLIELGDFKDMSQPVNEQLTTGYLKEVENVFSRFNGKRFHVFGNHDADCITKESFNAIAKNSGVRSDKTYYSFNKGGIHFIVLDACYDSTGRSYSKGNFAWHDSNIPKEELVWLKNDIAVTLNPVVVFTHQVLDGNGTYAIRNAQVVRGILENSGKVLGVFQGHYHEGSYSRINEIHYYTLRGLIEGAYPEGNSYAIVSISPRLINISGFRRAVSLRLKTKEIRVFEGYHSEGEFDWEPWEEQ